MADTSDSLELKSLKSSALDVDHIPLDRPATPQGPQTPTYKLYKRRFLGLVGMVVLSMVSAMPWPWFGPIANNIVTEFGFTLDEVNWLGNAVACVYLPAALLIPPFVSRYGFRRCCDVGAVFLILSGWIRFAGTSRSLRRSEAYALLMLGQLISAISQPVFQVLGPKYSEAWFDLNGRTTATMVIAIANPIGGALGQLISPLVVDTRNSILVLGIISTAVIPFVFLIRTAPPTPPTYSGSQESPSLSSLLRAMVGRPKAGDSPMSLRERADFVILNLIFGVLVAAVNGFTVLSAQILQPMGYSADVSGFMGACLLLSGIIAAVITAPLFDRVLTYHLAKTAKALVPVVGCAWLSLIWLVRPNFTGALFAMMAVIGVCSVTMLPVALELGCEMTRNADGSSAILWFTANLWSIIFVLVGNALRAGPAANPPLNMHRALIFNGSLVLPVTSLIFLLRGKQVRKELDEEMQHRAQVEEPKP
ncbi:MFS general substrate transporter [Pluteus cervinus]|uniref:MFS general substrate transporter n=1 Tax=Pluteus cervinus TaxID=181527 RepID=A0ACD3AT68_9AGAR|nr:MFS general substrate transporter [Pluteus cervinus]